MTETTNGNGQIEKYDVQVHVHCSAQARMIAESAYCSIYTLEDKTLPEEYDLFDAMIDASVGPRFIMFIEHEFTPQQALALQNAIARGAYDLTLPLPGGVITLKPLFIASKVTSTNASEIINDSGVAATAEVN
jgi:Asp-tRNA(Asn)/Glu-tRNA(Gln) amidotransferase A subunit family amidase